MQNERDILSRLVLPRVRQYFCQQQVSIREIDLRWGVTEAMARDGGAAAVCLHAIDQAAPLIFGMVGARRGWQPPQDTIADLREIFGEASLDRLSDQAAMTEVELLYAAYLTRKYYSGPQLQFPLFARQDSLSIELTGTPLPGDDTNEEIQALRTRLAAEQSIRVVPYADLAEFERKAEVELTKVVCAVLARADQRQTQNTTRVPRTGELQRLTRALKRRRPVACTGPMGAGLSWLVHRLAELDSAALVVDGRALRHGDLLEDIERTVSASHLSRNDYATSTTNPVFSSVNLQDERTRLIETCLNTSGMPKRIFFDHFEEGFVTTARADLAWLPTRLPRNTAVMAVIRDERLLRQAKALGWMILEVPSISPMEGETLAFEYLKSFAKTLTSEQVTRLGASSWISDLHTTRLVLDELRRFGSFEELDERINELVSCRQGQQVVEQIVRGLESVLPKPWEHAVKSALVGIAVSLRGLSDAEIANVVARCNAHNADAEDLSTLPPLPNHLWSAIRIGLQSALVARGELNDVSAGPVREWLGAHFTAHPNALRKTAAALEDMFSDAPQHRRYIELPGLAQLRDPECGLEKFLSSVENAFGILEVGESFSDGLLRSLTSEARARVVKNWVADGVNGLLTAVQTRDLGMVAARIGELDGAVRLLESAFKLVPPSAVENGSPEWNIGWESAHALRALLLRDQEHLSEICRELCRKLPRGVAETSAWLARASVIHAAVADGRIVLEEDVEVAISGAIVRAARQLGLAGHLGQALICSGQLKLGRARWRPAYNDFNGAARAGRKSGQARLLCQALERMSAVQLERNRFRSARHAAQECRELSYAAQDRMFEPLAFERLIEIERRRANWREAYALAEAYFARCREGMADVSRAEQALQGLEQA